jgi:hypothetical protein
MRRVQLAAAAIGVGVLTGSILGAGVALAVQVQLGNTFPASRIQVDTAPTTVDMPRRPGDPAVKTTVNATVLDWNGRAVPNVQVNFAIVSGPNKGRGLPSSRTNKAGKTTVSYANGAEPGIDAVQANFSDGLEVHRSNRHFVLWRSGPAATAIRSPATITAKPNCFQPSGAVALASDSFKAVFPRTTPPPSRTPASAPKAETGSTTITGENFNPFSAVLITFDAGPGGVPQSFETQTDAFGRFAQTVTVVEPAEGLHLIRADDFRQREADDASYQIPCYQPSVALMPPIGPPGFVTTAVGRGFPPNSPIAFLNWASVGSGQPAPLRSPLPANIKTDASGAFQIPVLVLYHDLLGPRMLRAIVPNDQGEGAGVAIEADAPFLVTPGRLQPSDFSLRR